MQTEKISELLASIRALENELQDELQKEYEAFRCEIAQKRSLLRERFVSDREGLGRYLATTPLLHLLSVPVIWSVLVPALFLDVVVTVYQAVCFPIYGIVRVRRRDYIVIDRHRLGYLNLIEKLNCIYCGYFNGLMGYISEIAARTEQYWCPIRHARLPRSIHSRYANFVDFEDSAAFREKKSALREALKGESEALPPERAE